MSGGVIDKLEIGRGGGGGVFGNGGGGGDVIGNSATICALCRVC